MLVHRAPAGLWFGVQAKVGQMQNRHVFICGLNFHQLNMVGGRKAPIVLNRDSLAYGSGLLTNFSQVLKETNAREKYIAWLWVGGDGVKEQNIHHAEKKNTKQSGHRRESEYIWDGNASLLHTPRETTSNEGGWRYWDPEGDVKKTTLTLTSHTYTHGSGSCLLFHLPKRQSPSKTAVINMMTIGLTRSVCPWGSGRAWRLRQTFLKHSFSKIEKKKEQHR